MNIQKIYILKVFKAVNDIEVIFLAKAYIENVFKNMRYKILLVENTYYILESTPSFWKILCPFLYWFSSFPVYKIEDRQTLEHIKTPNDFSKSRVRLSVGGFSVLAAYYLRFLTESSTVQLSFYLKMVMLFFAVVCVAVFRLYLNRVKRRRLYKIIDLEQLETGEVEVKPQSWKHVTQMACIYIFFLLLTLLFYYG